MKTRERLGRGLLKVSGWLSRKAFDILETPLSPKADRIKYGSDEQPEDDLEGEPVGIGAPTELETSLTAEARAMIAHLPAPTKEPEPKPLEGSVEARLGSKW